MNTNKIILRSSFGVLFTVVSAGASIAQPTLVFPQFANGEVDGARNKTRIVLRNNGDASDTGRIEFRDSNGSLVEVPVGGLPTSAIDYSLEPWGTLDIETDGTGILQTGIIEVISDRGEGSKIEGTEIFEILGNSVSVNSTPSRASHQLYISRTSEENTGMAAYNPDKDNSVTLDLFLLDNQGVEKARKLLELEGGQQRASFVDEEELFRDFFQANPASFQGTLNINVLGGGAVSTIGLLQKKETGALIAVSSSPNAFMGAATGVGIYDQAAAFTGSNYLQALDSPTLDAGRDGSSLTIECWIRVDSLPPPETMSLIVGKGSPDGDRTFELMLTWEGKIAFRVFVPFESTMVVVNRNDHIVTPGSWIHVGGLFDNASNQLISTVNGNVLPKSSWPTRSRDLLDSSGGLSVGGYAETSAVTRFAGRIEELRLSSIVRYEQSFIPAGPFENDGNTLGLWHFDSGPPFVDASGSGNTLLLFR